MSAGHLQGRPWNGRAFGGEHGASPMEPDLQQPEGDKALAVVSGREMQDLRRAAVHGAKAR